MRFLIILLFAFIATDGARQGNEAYNRGDFEAAEQAFRQAIELNPDDARLHFNLGNALAQQQRFEEAIDAYERFRSMANTPQERALADYNIGNMYGMQEEWDKAMEQFRSALRQNPADEEAKYNFEYANRSREQQQEQQQPDQQDQQDGDDDSEGDQQDQQQPDQQDQDQGEQDSESQQDQQDQQQNENEQQQQQAQMQPDLSEEDADRLLNALESKEQDLLREFHKNQMPPNRRHAKDW
jgi:Ca-activated chloride channel homolog